MNNEDTLYTLNFLPTLSSYVISSIEEAKFRRSQLLQFQNNTTQTDEAAIADALRLAQTLPLMINQYQEHVERWKREVTTKSHKDALDSLEANISKLRRVNNDILLAAIDLSKKMHLMQPS